MKTPVANPVLRRELLERWRGRRAITVLTIYLLLLGGLLVLLRAAASAYLSDAMRNGFGPGGGAAGPLLGRFLLENTLAVVLGLVLFIAPGYAAAQVAGERERRTLGLLKITLVRPRSIILGKLGASTAWIVLLVIASAPIAASAFVLGGATVGDLLRGLAVILVVAVGIAAVAIAVSARARRTTGAVVMTYGAVLTLVVGTLIVAFAQYAANDFTVDQTRPFVLHLNPFYALADATSASIDIGFGGLPSILTPFAAMLPRMDPFLRGEGMPMVAEDGFAQAAGSTGVWPMSVLLYVLLAAGAVALATRWLRSRDGVRET